MKRRASIAPKGQRAGKRTKSKKSVLFQASTSKKLERKNFDTTSTALIVAAQTTAVVTSIYQPDQGTAPTEHVGRQTKNLSLEYRFTGSFAGTTAGSSPLRLVIVYDRQPNAAAATAVNILVVDAIGSTPNLQNDLRFTTLVDQMIPEFGLNGPASFAIHGYRKMSLLSEFNDTNGGTIADITTGSFIALTYQNGNIITANPTTNLFTRIRFIDA